MTAKPLPDDHEQWPSDPHRLLGVTYQADQKQVKRAYTQLIRRFKPEQFPAHFQKVRAAYEAVLQQLEWRERFDQQLGDETDFERDYETEASTSTSSAPLGNNQPTSSSTQSLVDNPLRRSWSLAKEGKVSDAYAILLHWKSNLQPGTSFSTLTVGYCQLYWLLTVFPEVDPQTSPLDWLAQGLAATFRPGPLFTLYLREISQVPSEVFRGRFTQLLIDAPLEFIEKLLPIRWEAAAHQTRISCVRMIVQDMEHHLRPRVCSEDSSQWGRLLILAITRLLADANPPFDQLNTWVTELAESPDLHRQFERDLDYFELLQGQQGDWGHHAMKTVPLYWKRLFVAGELYPPGFENQDFQRLLSEFGTQPLMSLAYLEQLQLADPLWANQLRGLLLNYCTQAEVRREEHVWPTILPEIPTTLKYSPPHDKSFRDELMRFCLVNNLHPAVAAGCLRRSRLPDDDDLCLVYDTWRAFWKLSP